MRQEARSLRDLRGVGPATMRDFEVLGIRTVEQLAASEPQELYDGLCERTGTHHDICCLDVFSCAVAQARNPNLPPAKREWWYWSGLRKRGRK